MTWLDALNVFAAVATIATAIVAVYAYFSYRLAIFLRVGELKKMLAKKIAEGDNSLTAFDLAIGAGYTVEQVIEAAQHCKEIKPLIGQSGKERRYQYKPR